MKIEGKKFVVTGAGNGIGRDVALELLRKGAKVVGVDINPEYLKETLDLSNSNTSLTTAVLDIADHDAVLQFAAKHDDIDGLVNVAGIIQPFVRVDALEQQSIERVMNVNFFGPLNLIRAFLPTLKQKPEAHILNVSSMGSYAPVPGQTIYGASKAAINLLTEGLRSELSETGIKFTLVWPGAIQTNISSNSGIVISNEGQAKAPKMQMTSSVSAARQIVDAIETNKARIYIGSDAKFMGRLAWLSTDAAAKMIYKNLKHLLG